MKKFNEEIFLSSFLILFILTLCSIVTTNHAAQITPHFLVSAANFWANLFIFPIREFLTNIQSEFVFKDEGFLFLVLEIIYFLLIAFVLERIISWREV
jgi:hypothetical protein